LARFRLPAPQMGETNQMAILSIKFLDFVLVTLAVYYLLPYIFYILPRTWRNQFQPVRWQNLFLLGASYYYYETWLPSTRIPYYTILLLALTSATFGIGHWLYKSKNAKRAILWLGILLNIGLMSWFLIGGKILQNTLDFTVYNPLDIMPLLILPVGMSYYVLNSISYLLDINLRLAKPNTNFVDFALYLAWFPKLISGPLERARKFMPQLAEKRMVDNEAIVHSLTLILIGLFRTAILGGMLTLYLPAVPMKDPAAYGNPVLLWALITYMFYLYNQFAGYTDIVRGVSGLFGIQLSRNFNAPFFSKDFSDFWLRWHISLSQWLRDYIYMPASRAFLRRNPRRTNIPNLIVPPLITMLISGLWHGADFNHLVWGALMGLFIISENVRMLFRPARAAASLPLWRKISSRVWLVALMAAATVPFVLDLKQTLVFFVQLANGWNGQMFDLRPLAIILLSLLMDWFQYRSNDETVFIKWPVWSQTLLIAVIPLAVIVISQLQSAPPVFVYP
jgi:alginate O-acetyltransferase complex protein AlgI